MGISCSVNFMEVNFLLKVAKTKAVCPFWNNCHSIAVSIFQQTILLANKNALIGTESAPRVSMSSS
jgi:hypothetical protein